MPDTPHLLMFMFAGVLLNRAADAALVGFGNPLALTDNPTSLKPRLFPVDLPIVLTQQGPP